MSEFFVVLDGERVDVPEGETVAEFRERFDRDSDGGIVVFDEDGTTPWRYLYPEYAVREHMPSGHEVEFEED